MVNLTSGFKAEFTQEVCKEGVVVHEKRKDVGLEQKRLFVELETYEKLWCDPKDHNQVIEERGKWG